MKNTAHATTLSATNLLLQEFCRQFEQDWHDLSQAGSETLYVARLRLQRTREDWQTRYDEFKAAVAALPKELRQRDFMKSLLSELYHFEARLQRLRAQASEIDFSGVRESAAALSARLADLEHHPLIQKFLRGETVMSSRRNIQWVRKIGHASLGLFFLYLVRYSQLPHALVMGILTGFMVWGFSLETLRHFSPRVNGWVCAFFKPMMREREKTGINSGIFYMTSMLIVYWFFPPDIGMLTLLFIALGDPIAGIVGVYWGKRKLSDHVSLAGTLACFGACAVLAFVGAVWLFDTLTLSPLAAIGFALPAGLIGAVAELSFKKLDDNLVMPLLSAPLLWLLMRLFGA
jgi:diacylglycerol kinase (CTP)